MTPVPDLIQRSHMFIRVLWARANLVPVDPQYCIVWEDEIDGPAKVTHPAPHWLAMALNGGLLPPVDNRSPYARPIGPMSERQAMEYLLERDLPAKLREPSNRPRFAIVARSEIPADREYRNAWRLNPA